MVKTTQKASGMVEWLPRWNVELEVYRYFRKVQYGTEYSMYLVRMVRT